MIVSDDEMMILRLLREHLSSTGSSEPPTRYLSGSITHRGDILGRSFKVIALCKPIGGEWMRTTAHVYHSLSQGDLTAWRLTDHIVQNPCGEYPARVQFVGDRADFERDIALVKFALYRPR